MLARLTAFVVWALVAATAVFWGLRLLVRPQPAPSYAVAVGDAGALRRPDAPARRHGLLGRPAPLAAAPELASRFKLLGVMASKKGDRRLCAHRRRRQAGAGLRRRRAPRWQPGVAIGECARRRSARPRAARGAHARGAAPLPAAATGTLPSAADGFKFGAAGSAATGHSAHLAGQAVPRLCRWRCRRMRRRQGSAQPIAGATQPLRRLTPRR